MMYRWYSKVGMTYSWLFKLHWDVIGNLVSYQLFPNVGLLLLIFTDNIPTWESLFFPVF